MAQVTIDDPYGIPAPAAAKRTGTVPTVALWKRSDLRAYARDRAYGICEWPECGQAGDELAHLFGRGSGGRRSADTPENVAYLCKHHHDVLDGRRRLRFDDVRPLVIDMAIRRPRPGTPTGTVRCLWFCEEVSTTIALAMAPLCDRHEQIAFGEDVPTRRAELGLAMSFVIERANRSIGLRP